MQWFPTQCELLEHLRTKLTDCTVIKILVCAVATVRLHTTQACGCVFDADRKRRGGKSYHLTEKQLLCHVFYTAISNRSEDIFKPHSDSDNNVWFITPVISEMSMGNKYIQRGKAAGGHHVQSSDNNNFSQ